MRRAGLAIAAVMAYAVLDHLLTPRLCDRMFGAGAWSTIQDELSNRRTS